MSTVKSSLFGEYTSRAFLPSLNGVPLECGTPAVLVESRTKCFVKVAILIDGIEDTLFKGSGRHKTQILRGIEYCSTTLHEYYANNKLEESAIA